MNINEENIKELIDSLPQCEYYEDRHSDDDNDYDLTCKNPATWSWKIGWYNDYKVKTFHVECDKYTSQYGRDWRLAVAEGDVRELKYAKILRKILDIKAPYED